MFFGFTTTHTDKGTHGFYQNKVCSEMVNFGIELPENTVNFGFAKIKN